MFYIYSPVRPIFSLIFLVWTAGNQTRNTPSLAMELAGPVSTWSRCWRLPGQAWGTDTVPLVAPPPLQQGRRPAAARLLIPCRHKEHWHQVWSMLSWLILCVNFQGFAQLLYYWTCACWGNLVLDGTLLKCSLIFHKIDVIIMHDLVNSVSLVSW
jgi:hypothetical protein